jgi:hypothetical protein
MEKILTSYIAESIGLVRFLVKLGAGESSSFSFWAPGVT